MYLDNYKSSLKTFPKKYRCHKAIYVLGFFNKDVVKLKWNKTSCVSGIHEIIFLFDRPEYM